MRAKKSEQNEGSSSREETEGVRERGRVGTQSCRVLNEAKKTHHLATPHTLPNCAPKKCPQLTSKLPQNAVGRRGRQHKPGYEASNNLAQATRVKDKRTQS